MLPPSQKTNSRPSLLGSLLNISPSSHISFLHPLGKSNNFALPFVILLFGWVTFFSATLSAHDDPSPRHNSQKAPSIITSFYPLYYFSEQILHPITEDSSTVIINLSAHTPVHDYRLSPNDRLKIQQADLLILFGQNLEPWGQALASQLPSHRVLTINAIESSPHNQQVNDGHMPHGSHKNQHQEEHAEDHTLHHESHNDPHLWLDPLYSQTIVDRIVTKLLTFPYYQSYRSQLLSNADKIKEKLTILHQSYRKKMANCRQNTVLVSHNALGYLARRYDFNTHSILGLSTHDEPSAHTLHTLIRMIQKNHIRHFLYDGSRQSKSYLSTIDPDGKLVALTFHTLEQSPPVDKDFFSLSYHNLNSLVHARQCQP